MATGDFAWLKLQLAFLAGRNTVAELDSNPLIPSDSLLAGQCINEALLDCYMNPSGRRPGWALRDMGVRYSAPISGTVTVTTGSNTFTALAGVTAAMAGSCIQIGSGFYTLASTTSTVEPIGEPTGSQAFQLWHNSYVLDEAIVEVQGAPMIVGWGILRPMNGREESIRWRQITYGDFWSPQPYGVGQLTSINWPGGVSQPTGDPIFYWIDNSRLDATAAISCKMVIWPLPTQAKILQFQGWVAPTELTGDTDRPKLPADLVTRVLLPLARERWVHVFKKYTGQNQDWITRQADVARATLDRMGAGQRDKPIRQPIRHS